MQNSEFKLPGIQGEEPDPQIRLYSYCEPPLLSGNYSIKTTQKIVWDKKSLDQQYDKQQDFWVDGPRFTLAPGDVYSVFPPANIQGQYDTILPHIVLNKRTLPWERLIDESETLAANAAATPPTPWLALLLLDEDEFTGVTNATVGELVAPADPAILGPQGLKYVTDTDKLQPCMIADIPAKVFSAIVPARNELPYLAHCREVDMAYKELRSDVADGWFSVVVANRLPTTGKKNYACLVSLEGFGAYLYNNAVPATFTTVRMAVLATWSFNALPAKGQNFYQLVTDLSVCSLHLQYNTVPASDAEKLVADAFHDGYNALNYLTRQGEQTAAWYRGPFLPVLLNAQSIPPLLSPESAMIYDPGTGLFDLSYAVAWQLGRLLGLSDAGFAVALMQWRKQQKVQVNVQLEQNNASARLSGILPQDPSPSEYHKAALSQRVHAFLTGDFAEQVLPTHPAKRPLIHAADPTGVEGKQALLPGLLTREQLTALLRQGPLRKETLQSVLFTGSTLK